jgi:hypothetical protein
VKVTDVEEIDMPEKETKKQVKSANKKAVNKGDKKSSHSLTTTGQKQK